MAQLRALPSSRYLVQNHRMRIRKINGWRFSYPTRAREWMVGSQRCANALTGWLEAAIDLMYQGMGVKRAQKWWHDSVRDSVDGTNWCLDALDSEPREEAYAVLKRVGWILSGAHIREGSQVRPEKWLEGERVLNASMVASQDEEMRFRKLNFR